MCESCGTEVAINYPASHPTHCLCPWCGAEIAIKLCNGNQEILEKLSATLRDLEKKTNKELSDINSI
jgi:predicted RNA-binding Zn-ribbon protein involved in translation (DUF1610 family)